MNLLKSNNKITNLTIVSLLIVSSLTLLSSPVKAESISNIDESHNSEYSNNSSALLEGGKIKSDRNSLNFSTQNTSIESTINLPKLRVRDVNDNYYGKDFSIFKQEGVILELKLDI